MRDDDDDDDDCMFLENQSSRVQNLSPLIIITAFVNLKYNTL